MKTEFELESLTNRAPGVIRIIGDALGDDWPYVYIKHPESHDLYIKDSDLELFAINILKALKSKHLKAAPSK